MAAGTGAENRDGMKSANQNQEGKNMTDREVRSEEGCWTL